MANPDLFVAGDVAGQQYGVVQLGSEFLDVLPQPLVLVGQDQPRSRFIGGIGYAPRNAALVGNAHDQARLSFK